MASGIHPANSDLRTLWWKGGSLNGDAFPGYEKVFEELFTELFELDDWKLHEYFGPTLVPHSRDYDIGGLLEALANRESQPLFDRQSLRQSHGTSGEADDTVGAACRN